MLFASCGQSGSDINLVAKVQGSGFEYIAVGRNRRVVAPLHLFGLQVDTLFAKGPHGG
jgi:hypothetical protein